jgi:hypothetical protein
MHDLEAKACFHCESLARHFECTSHVDLFKGLEAACQARDCHLQSKLMSTLDALEKELQEGLTGKKVVVERVVPTRKKGCSCESKTAGLQGRNGYISRKLHKA